jgi:predicted ATPase
MLVLVLFRPEFTLGWRDLPHVASLTLNRLDKTQATTMIDGLAGQEPLSRTTIDQIIAKTDGVPLFVEEVTKAVLETADRNAASSDDRAPGASPSFPVPHTLHESLMARLDQLAPMKAIAQTAAVIGREFRLDLLEAVASEPKREVHAAIDRLLASGLLYRSGQPGDHHFTFKHALVQEEAYASLLNAERRRLHGRIAGALSERFAAVAERAPEVVAHHYTQAGQTKTAIDCWFAAGRHASARSAFVEASTHFRVALDLALELPAASQRDELELRLQYSLGSALAVRKGFAAAETERAFTRARELYDRLEPSAQSLSVLNGLIGVHVARGEYEQCRKLAEEVLTHHKDDPAARLIGHRALGTALFVTGELSAAHIELQNTVDVYDVNVQAPLTLTVGHDSKVTALAYLSLASVLQFDIDNAVKHGRGAVAHGEYLQHPHSTCFGLSFLAGVHLLWRDPHAVFPVVERCAALAKEHGFTQWIAGGQMLAGWIRLELGDAGQAVADLRRGIETMEQTGALAWVQFARYLLGAALLEVGETNEADDVVSHELLRLAGTSGRWYEAAFHRVKGNVQRARGDFAAAEACLETAVSIAARQGTSLWQLRAANDLASLLHAQGRSGEARDLLAPLCASLRGGVGNKDLVSARAFLAGTAESGSSLKRPRSSPKSKPHKNGMR